ncbi:MAG: metal-dependent transcriptional regulator [Peptostreptococcaceae bacterium]
MKIYHTFGEYIKLHDLSPSEEDYLEMIYRLQLDNNKVKVVELASSLNVSKPSASKMVKRLQAKDLIEHKNYGDIKLNNKGELIGKSLLLRHNTIEEFLKILGIKENLHDETEKIEHTVSHFTLDCIRSLVNFFNENEDIFIRFDDFIKNAQKD